MRHLVGPAAALVAAAFLLAVLASTAAADEHLDALVPDDASWTVRTALTAVGLVTALVATRLGLG